METKSSVESKLNDVSKSCVMLRNGRMMPLIGYGTWQVPKDVVANNVLEAIRMGVRHIDCAAAYGNEIEVGQGIAQAIQTGLVKREDLFITSKLWNTYHDKGEYIFYS
jgi:diketogulonate reductase-like aldo/keto reductase